MLAPLSGDIGANRANPDRFCYSNMIMGIQLIEQLRCFDVGELVWLETTCAYPKFTLAPLKEENLWDVCPEETYAPYGLAEKILLG